MRKKNPRYNQWIKRRLKHLEKKRKKKNKKNSQMRQAMSTSFPIENNGKNDIYIITAPSNFSIVDNLFEISDFFNKVIRFTNSKHQDVTIKFDLSKIVNIGADAIIYLLAVMQDLQKLGYAHHKFIGNLPKDENARSFFIETGFLNYMGARISPNSLNQQCIQVIDNNVYDQKSIQEVCDFVIDKSQRNKKDTKFLYVLINEMMSNTCEHAYTKESMKLNKWYLFAQKDNDVFKFTFVDIGLGIPKTVRTRFLERTFKSESHIIESALNGEFRTKTGKEFRGKGLPKIKECVSEQNLKNFTIISNKGCCRIVNNGAQSFIDNNELKMPIIGTVYYWEMAV